MLITAGSTETGMLLARPRVIMPREYASIDESTSAALPNHDQERQLNAEKAVSAEPEIVGQDLPKLELLATLIGAGKDRKACIRNLESGRQRMYSRGETVCSFTVSRIESGEVLLMNDAGITMSLVTNRPKKAGEVASHNNWIIQVADNKSVIRKDLLIRNAGEIIRSAGRVCVYPYARGDITGLQVITMPPDSIFAQSGLLPNDVIQAVNNQPVNTYQQALQIARKLPSQQKIEIKLVRNGKQMLMSFLMD